MKILFISNLFPPNVIGGYERLSAKIAEEFSITNDVLVLTSDYGTIKDYNDSFKVYRDLKLLVKKDNIYRAFDGSQEEKEAINNNNIIALEKIVSKEIPDLIFAWNLYFLDKSFLDTLKNLKTKIVFFLTDNWMISLFNADFLKHYFNKLFFNESTTFFTKIKTELRLLKNKMHTKSEKLTSLDAIFSSEFMKKLYKEAGISFKSSEVIYNGIDINDSADVGILRDYELQNKKNIEILFAGRIVRIKGVHIFVIALHKLIKKYKMTNIRATVIGDQEDDCYILFLKNLIDKYELNEHIIFKSFVKEQDLFPLFQKYDLYIFPSLYEPFSLTLIHALASGIPTLASDGGGNSEIVINGKTGIIYDKFSPNDLAKKIYNTVNNKELLKKISINGREKAKEFEFKDMCLKINDYLKKI